MRLVSARARRSGGTTLQMLVILVPVIFGFMGFAVDLGRLYMVRGELKAAADAMALAAAQELIGTEAATDNAAAAAARSRAEWGGLQNKYDFGGLAIGESNGNLQSTVAEPAFFETVAAAIQTDESSGDAGGTTARHVRLRVTAEAPLVFWRMFQVAQEGKTAVQVQSVAGISAPLCTACGIEGLVVAALDPSDEVNFGFGDPSEQRAYTFGYVCSGPNQPQPLAGTIQRLPYLILDHQNADALVFADSLTQVFRIGAGGLPPTTNQALGCVSVTTGESLERVWQTALPLACAAPGNPAQLPGEVRALLCGLGTRLTSTPGTGCETIPEVDTAAQVFAPDSSFEPSALDAADYTVYTGNRRRILTIAVAESLADPQAITILGFRQFLLMPLGVANDEPVNLNPSDSNGRFPAIYIGSKVPVRQGSFAGCQIASGPGKVVLHQ